MLNRLAKVLRYPDFRLLWIGAFLSFTGSWIQNVAQGYYVIQVTHNDFMLGLVTFVWSAPVLVFGLFGGSISDRMDKRAVLIWTQVVFTLTAGYLAVATYFHFVQYWQILAASFINGTVSCVEMPTRQSIVSRVVPVEDLAAAVPINAMTFNVGRIVGPAIGGIVLSRYGVAACYTMNAISFLALVWSGFVIKADLTSSDIQRGPMKDLVFEGAIYTFRDVRLRTMFLLEVVTAAFGLAYIALLPSYIEQIVSPKPSAGPLGNAFMFVGIGSVVGLAAVIQAADSRRKGDLIRGSMLIMAIGLCVLAWTRRLEFAYLVLGFVGMAAIVQLNTTNSLFQLLAPDRLRGRVLAMHIWALNGLSPFGVLILGELAQESKTNAFFAGWTLKGVPLSLMAASIIITVGAFAAFFSRRGLSNLNPDQAPI